MSVLQNLKHEHENEADRINMTESVSASSSLKHQRRSSQEEESQADHQRHSISAEKIQTVMQQMLSQKKVSFQSEKQKLALKTVLKEQISLMMMLSMSRNKSLLFMTSECLRDVRMMIVMTLFQTLTDDLMRWMKKIKINCFEWWHEKMNMTAMMMISADIVASWSFLNYASLL